MMNLNPWNVSSIDEFSYLNCPECDFHTKEKKNFQDHATRNHPLSAILFSKEVISFLNEINQLKVLSNDQKNKELELKHKLPHNDNIEKRQQVQKVPNEANKGFALPTEIVKIISLQKEKKLENNINNFHPSQSCEDQNENSDGLREEFSESNEAINFSGIPVEVIEVDYNDMTTSKFRENLVQIDSSNSDVRISSKITKTYNKAKKLSLVENENFVEHQLPLGWKKVGIRRSDNHTWDFYVYGPNGEKFCSNVEIRKYLQRNPEVGCDLDVTNISRPKNPQNLPSEKLLKTNLVTVHEEIQPYGCDDCKRYFSKKSDLMNHIESEHVEKESVKEPSECDTELTVSPFNEQIKCLICVESFPTENQLKEHVASVHVEVKQFPCSKCGKRFSRIELLQDHISIVHEGKNVFQCSLCDYKTKLKGSMTSRAKIILNRHIAAVHELKKPFECQICSKKFARKEKLKQHVLTVHEKLKLFQCSICNHKTGDKGNMKCHINARHEGLDVEMIYIGEKNYKCYNCDFKTGIKGDLNKHIHEVHDGKQNMHCEICNVSVENLKLHEKSRGHKIKLLNRNAPVQLKSKKKLEKSDDDEIMESTNIDVSTDDTLLMPKNELQKCTLCNNSFRTKQNLNKHIAAVHELKKPFLCQFCSKEFARKEKLKQHVLTVHEKLKLFQCSICNHKTGDKGNMKRHINARHEGLDVEIIYVGEKNYKCYNCDFKTDIKGDLNKHFHEVHYGKQNVHCEICNVSVENLKLHQKSRGHKIEILNKNVPVQLKSKKRIEKSDNDKIMESTNIDVSTDETLLMPKNELQNCTLCNDSFRTKSNLNRHIDAVHKLKKQFECKICDAKFTRNRNLKEHITIFHEQQKLFQCSICSFKSGRKENMKSHIDGIHEGLDVEMIYLGEKNYKCYSCDFKAGIKGDLNKHIHDVHDGKQNWHCDICNISFKSKLNLKGHEGKRCHITKKLNLLASPHEGNRQENITQSLRSVHKKETKSPVQDSSNESVHERKKEQVTASKKGRKATNASVEDLSIEEFIENHDPLEVNHVSSVYEESSKQKTQNGSIMPFLFGGINHVKPIQLTNIGQEINFPLVHEERKPYKCSFCDVSFLNKEHVKEHISIVHEEK